MTLTEDSGVVIKIYQTGFESGLHLSQDNREQRMTGVSPWISVV